MATAAYLQQAYLAYFGRPADITGLAAFANATNAQVQAAFSASAESIALYGTAVDANFINSVYVNVLGRVAEPAGITYWLNQIAIGNVTPAGAAIAILNGAQGTDVTTVNNKIAAATAFTAGLDTNAEVVGYSGTAAAASARTWLATITSTAATQTSIDNAIVAVVSGGGTTGTTYTLTTGADTLTGTSGNDTFIGLVDYQTTANSTLSAVDTIAGSSGTGDILSITTQGTTAVADALNSSLVSGIETVQLRAVSTAGVTLAAGNVSGMTLFNNYLSTDAVTVTGIASTTALKVTGNGTVTNGASNFTYGATVAAPAVTFDGGTTAGAVNVTSAGATSFTINSTGAKNVIGAIAAGATSTTLAATTINAAVAFETTGLTVGTATAGNQTLTISGAAADRAATATAVAKSAVKLGALDADFVTINASGLTAGGVEATLSATTTATFTGGTGIDRITTSAAGQTGAIDAGAGNDVLIQAGTTHINSTTLGAVYKNFEVLSIADGVSVDMDNYVPGSTITSVMVVDNGGTTSMTDMNATQAAAVTLGAGSGATLTLGIKNATTVGNIDTMTITVTDGDTTTGEACVTGAALTVAGVETINLVATDNFTSAATGLAGVTGLTSLVASGPGTVQITTGVHAVTANESVDFSALTTASTFNFAAATTNALAFKGGSGVDTVTDSVTGGNVITTNAGADSLTFTDKTGGTAGDTVTMGAGADTVSFGTAMGQAAIDAVTFKFAAGDSVSNSASATSVTNADTISSIACNDGGTAANGQKFTIDTEVSCTTTTITASTTAVVLGTTTVAAAYDFYVAYTAGSTDVYVYQDTNGNKTLEAGEFMIKLVGDGNWVANNANDWTISSGNLVFTSNDAA